VIGALSRRELVGALPLLALGARVGPPSVEGLARVSIWLVINRDCILGWGQSREEATPWLTSTVDAWGIEHAPPEEEPRAGAARDQQQARDAVAARADRVHPPCGARPRLTGLSPTYRSVLAVGQLPSAFTPRATSLSTTRPSPARMRWNSSMERASRTM
jgi:hypothetical protein